MGKRIKLNRKEIDVINEVKEDHYRIKNWVAKEWIAIIGEPGIAIYNILMSVADRKNGEEYGEWDKLSIPDLATYLQCTRWKICFYTFILEVCGLIKITPGDRRKKNIYRILTPPAVSYELLQSIKETLEEKPTSKMWLEFHNLILRRIKKWEPLQPVGTQEVNCPYCQQAMEVKKWQIKYNWPLHCEICGFQGRAEMWTDIQKELPVFEKVPKAEKQAIRQDPQLPKTTVDSAELAERITILGILGVWSNKVEKIADNVEKYPTVILKNCLEYHDQYPELLGGFFYNVLEGKTQLQFNGNGNGNGSKQKTFIEEAAERGLVRR